MFTSNGLACAAGVKRWRIRGLYMALALRVRSRIAALGRLALLHHQVPARGALAAQPLDVVAVVPSARNHEFELAQVREAAAGVHEQRVRAQLGIDDAEAGRAPR